MQQYLSFLSADAIKALMILAVLLILSFMVGFVCKRLHQKVIDSRSFWDDAFFIAARKPLQLLIWGLGLIHVLAVFEHHWRWLEPHWLDLGQDILVMLLLADFLLRFVRQAELGLLDETRRPAGKEERYDATTVHAVSKLVRAIIFIVIALIIMQILGYSVTSLIAFGGVGGIAVGFAARDLLANFFGALMLYMDKPFKVGDWIRSPDKNIEGVVEYIGWRLTCIRTFDKRPLYVPNSTFNNISVENPSRMHNRRIYETIGLRYDDAAKLEIVLQKTRRYLQQHEAIDTNQTLMVNFNTFGASSLDFFVYCFTKTTVWTEFHAIKEKVLMDIMEIITEAGAEIAFPTQTLHVDTLESLQAQSVQYG